MAKKKVKEKEPKWSTTDLGGREIWGLVHKLEEQVDKINRRIDRIVDAHDKCRKLKGL